MKYFALALILLFIPSGSADAQFNTDVTNQGPSITLEPRYPAPNSETTASLDDYSLSGTVSSIRWYINGKQIPDTLNQRSIDFKTGEMNSKTTINAAVEINGKQTLDIKSIIEPIYLDIIVEAQTRVPSFYKGRSLPSVGSKVNYTALLNGGSILPNNLIYNWSIENRMINGGSLRGQYKISAPMPQGGGSILSLAVSTISGEILARKDIQIPSVEPEILFYESNTLQGMKQIPIKSSLNLISNSSTVHAEPYYLNILTYNRPPLLEWKIDGVRSPSGGSNPYKITLAHQETQGSAEIDFHVRDLTEFLQGGQSSINVNF
jgi:hypothetical protein